MPTFLERLGLSSRSVSKPSESTIIKHLLGLGDTTFEKSHQVRNRPGVGYTSYSLKSVANDKGGRTIKVTRECIDDDNPNGFGTGYMEGPFEEKSYRFDGNGRLVEVAHQVDDQITTHTAKSYRDSTKGDVEGEVSAKVAAAAVDDIERAYQAQKSRSSSQGAGCQSM